MKSLLIVIVCLAVVAGTLYYAIDTAEPETSYPSPETSKKREMMISLLKEKNKNFRIEIPKTPTATPPRYIREGFILVRNVLITNYAWNEIYELRWKGKSSLGKSTKNDYGCAINTLDFDYGDEFYFPHIKDYRVGDDTFIKKTSAQSRRRQKNLMEYWSGKTGKCVTTHIDIRWKDKSCLRNVKTGVYDVWVKRK